MKSVYPKYLILILFAFSNLFLNAQEPVILIAPTIDLSEGQETVDVDIKVASFINVSGMQFTLRWDADVLEFMHVDSLNFGLDFLTFSDNFGITEVDQGILTFFWLDESFQGTEVIDGTTIFSFSAKVIGAPGATTTLEFSNMPTAIELSDPSETPLNVETRNGIITVFGVSSVSENQLDKRITITPNPFKENTRIEFNLNSSSDARLKIYDIEGKLIIEKVEEFGSGLQTIHIQKNKFSTAGTYYLHLTTEEFQVSKKLIFVK